MSIRLFWSRFHNEIFSSRLCEHIVLYWCHDFPVWSLFRWWLWYTLIRPFARDSLTGCQVYTIRLGRSKFCDWHFYNCGWIIWIRPVVWSGLGDSLSGLDDFEFRNCDLWSGLRDYECFLFDLGSGFINYPEFWTRLCECGVSIRCMEHLNRTWWM